MEMLAAPAGTLKLTVVPTFFVPPSSRASSRGWTQERSRLAKCALSQGSDRTQASYVVLTEKWAAYLERIAGPGATAQPEGQATPANLVQGFNPRNRGTGLSAGRASARELEALCDAGS